MPAVQPGQHVLSGCAKLRLQATPLTPMPRGASEPHCCDAVSASCCPVWPASIDWPVSFQAQMWRFHRSVGKERCQMQAMTYALHCQVLWTSLYAYSSRLCEHGKDVNMQLQVPCSELASLNPHVVRCLLGPVLSRRSAWSKQDLCMVLSDQCCPLLRAPLQYLGGYRKSAHRDGKIVVWRH